MDPADLRHPDHSTAIGGVDFTRVGAVHLQGAMNPPPMTVGEVISEDSLEMSLVDHDHVVETVSTDGPGQPLDVGILPRGSSCGKHLRLRTMYFSTVDFATSIPIFASSPTIRGDPQSGLAEDILRIRSRTSPETVGRPGFPDRLSLRQCSRNRRRRHAMTVSGWTKTSTSRQRDQWRESQVQRIRSAGRTRGRLAVRW
jgi:hypothetical protein